MQKSLHSSNRLRQLRAFCLAAQSGSVSLAAEALNISQPSVSLLIKSLEEDFQIKLFERRGPRIDLTPQGKTLLEISDPLVKSMDQIEEMFFARMGKTNSGAIHIASAQSTALYMLPKYISAFHNHYEKVEIHLHPLNGRKSFTQLREGEIDFMVGSISKRPDDILYSPLHSYRPMLITALNHPLAGESQVSLNDISQYKMVMTPASSTTRQMVETVFKQNGMKMNISLETNGWEVVKKYVSQEMGISIVSEICLTGEDALAEITMDQYFPSRSYGIITCKGKTMKSQAQKFIQLMDKDFFNRSQNVK